MYFQWGRAVYMFQVPEEISPNCACAQRVQKNSALRTNERTFFINDGEHLTNKRKFAGSANCDSEFRFQITLVQHEWIKFVNQRWIVHTSGNFKSGKQEVVFLHEYSLNHLLVEWGENSKKSNQTEPNRRNGKKSKYMNESKKKKKEERRTTRNETSRLVQLDKAFDLI